MNRPTKLLRAAAALAALIFSAAAFGEPVAVMGAGSPALTKDQVAAVYLGRTLDFKPVDQPEGTPVRDAFYKKVVERDAAQVKAVWSRIIFTGKGQAPKELPDAAAVKKAVAADPKAIGYIDKSAVDSSVKVVLAVD